MYKIFSSLSIILLAITIIMSVWLVSILILTNYEINILSWMPLSIWAMAAGAFICNTITNILFEQKLKNIKKQK